MTHDERRVAAELSSRPSITSPADDLSVPPSEIATRPLPTPTEAVTEREAPKRTARVAREVVETLLLALVIFVGVRLVVLNFRVDGSSMVPNLHDREMLLINRNVYFHFDANELWNLLPGDDREGDNVVYPFHPLNAATSSSSTPGAPDDRQAVYQTGDRPPGRAGVVP